MKTAIALLSALFLVVASAMPAAAQTRTVTHSAPGGHSLTIDLLDGWDTSIDADNNLLVYSPTKVIAFSLSLAPTEPGYTLDRFAREAMGVADAFDIVPSGEGLLPPYSGSVYLAKMGINGQTLKLKMIIVQPSEDRIVSATMIMGQTATAEDKAVGELIMKTIRVVN